MTPPGSLLLSKVLRVMGVRDLTSQGDISLTRFGLDSLISVCVESILDYRTTSCSLIILLLLTFVIHLLELDKLQPDTTVSLRCCVSCHSVRICVSINVHTHYPPPPPLVDLINHP